VGRGLPVGARAFHRCIALLAGVAVALTALLPAASAADAATSPISVTVEIVNGTAFTELRRAVTNTGGDEVWFEVSTYFPVKALLSRIAVESGGAIVEEAQVAPAASNSSHTQPRWLAALADRSAPRAGARSLDLAVRAPAHGSSVLIVGWAETLRALRGAYRYALPLATLGPNNEFSFEARIASQASLSALTASAPFEVAITRPTPSTARVAASNVALPRSMGSLFLNFTPEAGGGHGLASSCADGDGGFFTYTLFPSSLNLALEPLPKSVSFAIDFSGSMTGTIMTQAKDALKAMLHQLAPFDRFEVLRFDSRIIALTNGIEEATTDKVEAAIDRIYGQSPSGSTNIGDVLDVALTHLSAETNSLPMVVLITDGAPNVGLTTLDEFVSLVETKNSGGASIHTLALGYETSDEILGTLSDLTHGFHRIIDPAADVVQQISDFYGEVSQPLIEDLTLNFSAPAFDAAVPPLPVLFAGSDITVHGRLHGGGGTVTVTIEGRTTKGLFSFTDAFTPEVVPCGAAAVSSFAAGTLDVLIARTGLEGETPAVAANATALAMASHFETPWTKFHLGSGEPISTQPLPVPPAPTPPPQPGRTLPFFSEPNAPLWLAGIVALAAASSLFLRWRRTRRGEHED
jgi:uncharacterized protein YegL